MDRIRIEITEEYKVGITSIGILTQPKEICPNCGREHYGEGVKVYGDEGRRTYWHGCLKCWERLTQQMPLAFEMAEALRRMEFIDAVTEELLERWEETTRDA